MSVKPTISVVMPAYNAEKYLKEAIDSILAQTFSDFELLIGNDKSTDNTMAIIESYDDSRIRLIRNEKNRGVSYTLNRLISESKGAYVARMDADDYSHPKRFELQIQFMEANPDISIIGTYFQHMDTKKLIRHSVDPEIQRIDLLQNTIFGHPTVMMRKLDIENKGLKYDESLSNAEDYKLWVEATKLGLKTSNIPKVLLDYRIHPEQQSSANKLKEQEEIAASIKKDYASFFFGDLLDHRDLDILASDFKQGNIDEKLETINKIISASHLVAPNYRNNFQHRWWRVVKKEINFSVFKKHYKSKDYSSDFKQWLFKHYFHFYL